MAYALYTNLLRPTRSGTAFNGRWSIVGGSYYTWTDCVWYVNGSQYYSNYGQSGSMSADTLQLDQANFYPNNQSATVREIKYCVRGADVNGVSGFVWSPPLNVRPPLAPSVSIEMGSSANTVNASAEANSVEDDATTAYPRANMTVIVAREDSKGGKAQLASVTTAASSWQNENPITISDPDNIVVNGGWIKATVTAYSSGIGGQGAAGYASVVFAKPPTPSITSIGYNGSSSAGEVTIPVNTNATEYHPVATVKLQRAVSTTAETAAEAVSASWSDVTGKEGGAGCAGFTDNLAEAWPSDGRRTWYRVANTYNGYTQYSTPVQLPVFKPAPTAGKAHVYSATAGDDGTSAVIGIAWEGETPATGLTRSSQISWAKTPYAWEATSGVNLSSEFTWEDASPKWTSGSFNKTATIYISGLTEGETVYVRARRVQTTSEGKTYGDWSGTAQTTPASAPAYVTLSAPGTIARGEQLPLTWTVGSSAPQRAWRVIDSAGTVWGSGDGADGAFTIPASALAGLATIKLKATVTTGGAWVDSGYLEVGIADPPSVEVECDATLTAQPLTASVTANAPDLELTASVVAHGVSYDTPSGKKIQYAGDVVWAGRFTPDLEWNSTDEVYEAEIELPEGMPILDGAAYDVRITATDAGTGLTSVMAEDTFSVAWAHQAGLPSCEVATDAGNLTATLELIAPDGAAETDAADVYRLTPDGAEAIAEDVAFGSTVTDRYAPFASRASDASCAYRVATRTADGDTVWDDFEYEMRKGVIRLDWADRSLELPYNLDADEGIAKDFKSRTHMDGVTEGYWNEGSTRTASLATSLIRIESDEQRTALREMARHAGAVFVRIGNGVAFDADVQLGKMREAGEGGAVEVSLECKGIALTDEHKCDGRDIVAPGTTTTV